MAKKYLNYHENYIIFVTNKNFGLGEIMMNNKKTLPVEFTKSQVDNLMEALKKLRAIADAFDNEPIKEQDCDNIDCCRPYQGDK
jgi:hypothetical protein